MQVQTTTILNGKYPEANLPLTLCSFLALAGMLQCALCLLAHSTMLDQPVCDIHQTVTAIVQPSCISCLLLSRSLLLCRCGDAVCRVSKAAAVRNCAHDAM